MTMATARDASEATDFTFHDIHGPVHVRMWEGPPSGTPMVLCHGLGGSHLNWALLAPLLAHHGPVYALDLPGFGKSEPGPRRATVEENTAVLIRFLEWVGGPALLAGNSMGGMISILAASQRPDLIHSLVLVDPALPHSRVRVDPMTASMATGTLSLYASAGSWVTGRLSLQARAKLLMAACGVDGDHLPASLIEDSIRLLAERVDVAGLDRSFLTAARSLLKIMLNPTAYYEAMRAIQAPVLLLHGDQDRLVPVSSARAAARRNPEWVYVEMAGVGHCPQLQVPQATAETIMEWMA